METTQNRHKAEISLSPNMVVNFWYTRDNSEICERIMYVVLPQQSIEQKDIWIGPGHIDHIGLSLSLINICAWQWWLCL